MAQNRRVSHHGSSCRRAHGRCNRVACSAASTSVPRADLPTTSCFARLVRSSRFRHILHRAQDPVVQYARPCCPPNAERNDGPRLQAPGYPRSGSPRPFRRSMDNSPRKSTFVTLTHSDVLCSDSSPDNRSPRMWKRPAMPRTDASRFTFSILIIKTQSGIIMRMRMRMRMTPSATAAFPDVLNLLAVLLTFAGKSVSSNAILTSYCNRRYSLNDCRSTTCEIDQVAKPTNSAIKNRLSQRAQNHGPPHTSSKFGIMALHRRPLSATAGRRPFARPMRTLENQKC